MPGVSRRLVLGAGLAALPRVAIGQQARPILTVAVQKIANTGLLDPLREQSSNASEHYLGLILETPIGRNQQGALERVPGLAESWRRVDARTVELTIRPGVIMHDGRTLTAEDVAWSFGPRMFGGDTPADAQAVAKRHWPALESVTATGPLTVRLVNRTPDLTMEGRLAAGGSEVVSAAAHQAAGQGGAGWVAAARHPVGTGAYRVASFRPDVELVLEAHDAWWGGRPPLASVRFVEVPEAAARADGLRAGQYQMAADIGPDQIADIERDKRLVVQGGLVPNHRIVVFDHHHPALRDARVRLAMAHAIDGQAIVDGLWAGRAAVPAGLQFPFYGPMFVQGWTVPPFDPARAASLLHDAGYNGEPIPYRIRNGYYTAEVDTAQVLVEMWRAVGIKAEIQVCENWSQVLDTTRPRGVRDWSNSAVFDDPVSSIVNQHGPNGAQQTNGEWTNAEMNHLSPLLESGTDEAERKHIFARMLRICEREDPAYVVLHQNASFTAVPRALRWRVSPSFFLDLARGFSA
jgi:peptide/nickel transport system substrate-binding protein